MTDDPIMRWIRGEPDPEPPRPPRHLNPVDPTRASSYGAAALAKECERVRTAEVGERNETLNLAAYNIGQLVAGGALNDNDAYMALADAAHSAGLDGAEIRATLRSGMTAGAKEPRTAPIREEPWNPTNATSSDTNGGSTQKPTTSTSSSATSADTSATDESPTESSWALVDLGPVLAGHDTEKPPNALTRDDNHALLYAGKIHTISGESESLKSWLMQYACAQEIANGNHVGYIDFEDGARGVVGRMTALGASSADILRAFHYIRPVDPLDDAARQHVTALLELRPTLVIIDGVTEAMSMHGLNPLDNGDVARFLRIPRAIASRGPATAMIDHVVKNAENRGRYAIGAQHKLAGVDGAAYTVEVVRPFGRGRTGEAKVLVSKDRPGYVREHAAGRVVARLHLVSDAISGLVAARLEAPSADGDQPFRPTHLMAKVSDLLAQHPQGLSKSVITDIVGGKADYLRKAFARLEAEGYVVTDYSRPPAHMVTLIKPYIEGVSA